jgi:alcohol dehydrogenase class IV
VSERLPGAGSVEKAVAAVSTYRPRVIIAVGGGAVLDTAKVTALSISNPGLNPLDSSAAASDAVDLIAIPTTSGSGSERTPFAVYYEGSTKFSVEHESLIPQVALVDPTLTYSLTPGLTASGGLDVLSHAIEAAWAVGASEDSRAESFSALHGAWTAIGRAVHEPDPAARRTMARASTDAGAAIATAKTTASHALSYYMTALHNVSHGHAAAITLGAMLLFNADVDLVNCTPGADPTEVRQTIGRICVSIGAIDVEHARHLIEGKLTEVGLPNRLSDLGIERSGIERMADSVNQERLANNPRRFDRDQLVSLLEGLG